MITLWGLRPMREGLGVTQTELAKQVGTPVCTISRLERKPIGCNIGMAYRIAQALGCAVDDIIVDTGDAPSISGKEG